MNSKRIVLSAIVVALAAFPLLASAQAIEDKSFRDEAGNLVLHMDIVVPTSQTRVWELWTTAKGLSTWMAPKIAIDLRIGGIWESVSDIKKELGDPGNVKNEILAFVPNTMLAMRIIAFPPDFPLDIQKVMATHTVLTFEKLGDRSTRVSLYGVGYKDGPEWEVVYQKGLEMARQTLETFYGRCTRGPSIWQ